MGISSRAVTTPPNWRLPTRDSSATYHRPGQRQRRSPTLRPTLKRCRSKSHYRRWSSPVVAAEPMSATHRQTEPISTTVTAFDHAKTAILAHPAVPARELVSKTGVSPLVISRARAALRSQLDDAVCTGRGAFGAGAIFARPPPHSRDGARRGRRSGQSEFVCSGSRQ